MIKIAIIKILAIVLISLSVTDWDIPAVILAIVGTFIMILLEREDKKIETKWESIVVSLLISGVSTFIFSLFKQRMSQEWFYVILTAIAAVSPNTIRIAYKELPTTIWEVLRNKINQQAKEDSRDDDNL